MTHPPLSSTSLRQRSGLTLVELLVTLVLSTLVLGMVLPLMTNLLKSQPIVQGLSSLPPPWQRALQADLQELVSPTKCGVPVFQILPPSDSQPYPELVLQTFCRASGTDIHSLTRGPSEVRYRLETDSANGPLALVRYAKGWHDPATTRYVLANHLTSWSVNFEGVAPTLVAQNSDAASGTSTVPPPLSPPPPRPGRLVIQQTSLTGTDQLAVWVPLLPPSKPNGDSAESPADTDSPMETPP